MDTRSTERRPCAAGTRCLLQAPCDYQHKCPGRLQDKTCGKWIHAICGVEIPDPVILLWNRWCFECASPPQTTTATPASSTTTTTPTSTSTTSTTTTINNTSTRNNVSTPSIELSKIRENMRLDKVKQNVKAKSTFKKHAAENEIFLMWLYNNSDYCNLCLDENFIVSLNERKEIITFTRNFERTLRKLITEEERNKKKQKYIA